jgi:hypothetical protein
LTPARRIHSDSAAMAPADEAADAFCAALDADPTWRFLQAHADRDGAQEAILTYQLEAEELWRLRQEVAFVRDCFDTLPGLAGTLAVASATR